MIKFLNLHKSSVRVLTHPSPQQFSLLPILAKVSSVLFLLLFLKYKCWSCAYSYSYAPYPPSYA